MIYFKFVLILIFSIKILIFIFLIRNKNIINLLTGIYIFFNYILNHLIKKKIVRIKFFSIQF